MKRASDVGIEHRMWMRRHRQTGFTLVELLVVVAIITILGAIAFPAYQDSVRKSRRADAKTALTSLASRQEQYFNDNKAYASSFTQLGLTNSLSENQYYQLSIWSTNSPVSHYTLTATPHGAQTTDTDCTSLTIDDTGSKASSPRSDCWTR